MTAKYLRATGVNTLAAIISILFMRRVPLIAIFIWLYSWGNDFVQGKRKELW